MQPTNRDFRDLFYEFAAHRVRYLVVGAYAVTHYSRPRFTKDLDIWVDPEPENARRALEALAAYGAPVRDLRVDDLVKPGNVFQIGITTTRIDILTSAEGLAFARCWPRRTAGEYMDTKVHYLGQRDLIRNKTVARPQDLADVARLEGKTEARRARRRAPSRRRRRP